MTDLLGVGNPTTDVNELWQKFKVYRKDYCALIHTGCPHCIEHKDSVPDLRIPDLHPIINNFGGTDFFCMKCKTTWEDKDLGEHIIDWIMITYPKAIPVDVVYTYKMITQAWLALKIPETKNI